MRWPILLVVISVILPQLFGQDSKELFPGLKEQRGVELQGKVSFAYRSGFQLEHLKERFRDFKIEVLETFPARRVAILSVHAERTSAFLTAMRKFPGVRAVNPLLSIDTAAGRKGWYALTDRLVLRFHGEPTVNQIQPDLDAVEGRLIKPLRWLPGAFLIRVPRHRDALQACQTLMARRAVEWAHPNWLRYLGTRESVPNDPLFANLWHLKNTGQGGGLLGIDMRATFAWDMAKGTGMSIAVIDTGVDGTHSDLNLAANGYNPITGTGPTAGADLGGHGTSVAGVAAATGDNSSYLAGVAHQATVLPIRLLNGSSFGTPTEEAACFIWAADNGADVITNSWGPDGIPFILPILVEQSFAYAASVGRNGLGCPIIWAAGNGNETIATDEYVANVYTLSVGAVTNLGVRSSYSDYGPELDVVAPSSGGTRAINTTTLGGSTTLNFGGTSASAPMAAGIAALVLEVNPLLLWSQVHQILRDSATQIDTTVAVYDATGHNIFYGHGLLNAEQAVLDSAATLPQPLAFALTTTGIGDIIVDIKNMHPYAEWAIGFSAQIFNPIGSGPIFGVGWDSLITFFQPVGVIPFHAYADANGNFYWGAVGLPSGLTLQAVAIEVLPDFSFRPSQVVQVTF